MLNACVDQASSDIEFKLFNQTDKAVKVLGFNSQLNSNINKANPINIEPNSSFKVTRISGFDDNVSMSFYSLRGGVDSVRVVFDSEKVLILTLEGTFNQGQTIFQGDKNYQHFITEQDYENATACNGNCE